ncbi:inner membrane protein [Escherichia coli]|uniref:Inner membrane protein n=1 Tax=Escherichia coli TaxID=562 RepID=A0A376KSF8_ECOLX|nr:inner membrane protein [Escherichia coli]
MARQSTPLDERTERLILALVFAAKSDGHIDGQRTCGKSTSNCVKPAWKSRGRVLIEQAIEQPLDPQRLAYRGPQ